MNGYLYTILDNTIINNYIFGVFMENIELRVVNNPYSKNKKKVNPMARKKAWQVKGSKAAKAHMAKIREQKKNPNGRKTRKTTRKTTRKRNTSTRGHKRAWQVKGSKAAKAHMAKIRGSKSNPGRSRKTKGSHKKNAVTKRRKKNTYWSKMNKTQRSAEMAKRRNTGFRLFRNPGFGKGGAVGIVEGIGGVGLGIGEVWVAGELVNRFSPSNFKASKIQPLVRVGVQALVPLANIASNTTKTVRSNTHLRRTQWGATWGSIGTWGISAYFGIKSFFNRWNRDRKLKESTGQTAQESSAGHVSLMYSAAMNEGAGIIEFRTSPFGNSEAGETHPVTTTTQKAIASFLSAIGMSEVWSTEAINKDLAKEGSSMVELQGATDGYDF